MPAVSRAQQIAMAIAEHHPEKLYKRNRSMLSMTGQQLHDFASGSMSGKPKRKRNPKNTGAALKSFARQA